MISLKSNRLFSKASAIAVAFAALSGTLFTAHGQVTENFLDTSSSGISTNCGAATTRTFDVTTPMTITDVDFGLIVDHDNRGDIIMVLDSPLGTRTYLIDQNGSFYNDYNVEFDQSAGEVVDTGSQRTNNNVADTPYRYPVRPEGNMNDFIGESAVGTWMMLTCDPSGFTTGSVERAELILTGTQDFADLRLDLSASPTNPSYGGNTIISVDVTNEVGDLSTNGVTADVTLPSGLTYVSHSGAGTFNSGTGVWTIGTLAPGASAQLQITAQAQATGSYTISSEITASSTTDPDSTPGNSGSSPFEDDSDSLTLSPGAASGGSSGVAPTLSCSVPDSFDWDSNAWPSTTTLSNTYPAGGSDGTTFAFAFTGDTDRRNNGTPAGDETPVTDADFSGGLAPAQQSLRYFQNTVDNTESVTITIDVGTAGTGVAELQFDIFDIDYGLNQFRDRIEVIGYLGGVSVMPVLTDSEANDAFGNVVSGVSASGATESRGNMTITFTQPVDQVTINYSNSDTATGTRNQAMSVHDLAYCPREYDAGDAPSTYTTAAHLIVPGFYIGSTAPDGEVITQNSTNADADDTTNVADEGSIVFPTLYAGQTATLDVPVTGANGFLQAWIDWNDDGDFDDTVGGQSEQVAVDATILGSIGTASLPLTIPANAALTPTIARLRWSADSGLASSGLVTSGEVEDYLITVQPAPVTPPLCGTDPALTLISNGDFTNGGASAWTDWTTSGAWTGADRPRAQVANQSTLQQSVVGLKSGPSSGGGPVVHLNVLWEEGGGASNLTRVYINVNGSLQARIDGPTGAGNIATITYSGGTTGNISQLTAGVLTPLELQIPTGLTNSGNLNIQYNGATAATPAAFSFDDVEIYACPSALLSGQKTNAIYDPTNAGLYALPGNDVIYTITVTNEGSGATDADSVFLSDAIPAEIEFWNGDIDSGGGSAFPGTDPVGFVQTNGSALTLTYGTDIAFATGGTPPANFGQCSAVAPDNTYRPDLTFLCINPKGQMAAGDPDPTFSVSFRARIK